MNDHRIVTHIRVVFRTLGALGPQSQKSHNHWSIYLILANKPNSSIRINMRAEYPDPTGILEWEECEYILPKSAISYWDFPACPNARLMVLHISRMIYFFGRDEYKMSGGGSGCQYWV